MPEVDELEMKARVGEILNRWPAVGLAVGVVRNGSLEFFHGHGVADIPSKTRSSTCWASQTRSSGPMFRSTPSYGAMSAVGTSSPPGSRMHVRG